MKRGIKKAVALCLTSLMIFSNVMPAFAAHEKTAGDYWKRNTEWMLTPISPRRIVIGETASPTTPTEPTQPGDSIPEATPPEATSPTATPPVATIASAMKRLAPVTITDETMLLPYFPDEAFRGAVFAAVKGNTGDSIEDILANYTGSILAEKKGIKSIKGFQYLKNAGLRPTEDDSEGVVDLRHNEITDWRPAMAPSSDYYGSAGLPYANVGWDFGGNPLAYIPDHFGNNIIIEQLAETSYTYEDGNGEFAFIRNSNETFSHTFPVKRCQIADGAALTPVKLISVAPV